VSGADEKGVDGVAAGTCETVAFEQAVGLPMADNRLGRRPSAQFALDRRRSLTPALNDVDFGPRIPVTAKAVVDLDCPAFGSTHILRF
jgi:hypothetical protein